MIFAPSYTPNEARLFRFGLRFYYIPRWLPNNGYGVGITVRLPEWLLERYRFDEDRMRSYFWFNL